MTANNNEKIIPYSFMYRKDLFFREYLLMYTWLLHRHVSCTSANYLFVYLYGYDGRWGVVIVAIYISINVYDIHSWNREAWLNAMYIFLKRGWTNIISIMSYNLACLYVSFVVIGEQEKLLSSKHVHSFLWWNLWNS